MAYEINGNVRAFLWVIRHCEGTPGPNGYRTIFGGSLFDDFSKHPGIYIPFGKTRSSAAGAYQFLERTWKALAKQHGFKDFSPESQDQGAVELIRGRNALKDVEEGRFESALRKCSPEWASLPFSTYGQPTKKLEFCKQIYEQYGGKYMVAPVVAAVAASVAPPFLEAAFNALVQTLPTLGKIFSSGSPVAQRNVQVMETVVNAIQDQVGAKNAQEAVQIVQEDPVLREEADALVKVNALDWFNVDLSGVQAAREVDIKRTESNLPFWKSSPAFAVTAMLLPLLYMTMWFVLKGDPAAGFTSEMKSMAVSAVIAGILGGVTGFWLGSSFTTSRSRGLGATPQ